MTNRCEHGQPANTCLTCNLDELGKLHAATSRPAAWRVDNRENFTGLMICDCGTDCEGQGWIVQLAPSDSDSNPEADARWIAEAHNAYPQLAAEIRKLRFRWADAESKLALCDADLQTIQNENAALKARVSELEGYNLGLATEAERLKSGLRWYAHGNHYCGLGDWEAGADPECPQWMEPDPDGDLSGAMVEDGHCARYVLSGGAPDWDGDEPLEHPCEPGMQAIAALTPKETP